MSFDQLLATPAPADLGLVQDLFDTAMLRLKVALVKRCGGDVPIRLEVPRARALSDVLEPIDDLAIGAAAPFTLLPSNERGLVTLDVPLVQRCVGLFLGEDPGSTAPTPPRRLTRLDLQMARWICDDVVDALVQSCALPHPPRAVVDAPLANPRSIRSLPAASSVIEVEFEMGPPRQPFGRASVVLPPQCAGVLWPDRREASAQQTATVPDLERVLGLQVPIVAELGRRTLPLSALQGFSVGDRIELGGTAEVEIRAAGRLALLGEPGEQGGFRSVRVRMQVHPQGRIEEDR